jgi:4-alpha-glucanotransferase
LPLREGILRDSDYRQENKHYHLYAQWLAHQQLDGVKEKAEGKGVKLYMDMPMGVHPDSYDTWREREAFITGISVGAPPDTVFTRGQNWSFPALHPKNIREQGYRYFIASLRHHLKHADIIRIDHVMGLHRIFCIPEGLESSQGVYLRYRADELYAILALESQRNKAVIVGEDLGTVPRYVRPAMKQHGINRMYVLHYEMAADSEKEPLPVPPDSVASLNTHDMPPFIAFWQGLDITERRQLGLLDRENARKEKKARRNMVAALGNFLRRKGWLEETGTGIEAGSALRACLEFLTSSPASLVLVNLEDLWQETEPQNVPSTREEYPNWQRKAKYNFEEFCQLPTVLDTLRTINKLRNRKR